AAASTVESTTSQNITVSCRRSPARLANGEGERGAPQPPQKALSAGFARPHAPQVTCALRASHAPGLPAVPPWRAARTTPCAADTRETERRYISCGRRGLPSPRPPSLGPRRRPRASARGIG